MISALIEILPKVFRYFRKTGRRDIMSHTKVLLNTRFFNEKSLMGLLSRQTLGRLPGNRFLDGSLVLSNGYYAGECLGMDVRSGRTVRRITVPYKEVIDYTKSDHRIYIANRRLNEDFRIPDGLMADTQEAFEAFLRERNVTSNDESLRIKSLELSPYGFKCTLQRARYYDQIRTNLTLDYLMEGLQEDTLRMRDLGRDNSLPSFADSMLANTIGVCAIWVMARPSSSGRKAEKFYYLLPRKKTTGVYNGTLGTVSGVVQAPPGGEFGVDTLEDYVAGEIRREFYEETGVDTLFSKGVIAEDGIKIIPLAFTRDLVRGGKPQFFFLIATKYIPAKMLRYAFRRSFNGSEEFDSNAMTHMPTFEISVETYLNFLYALSYIQTNRRLPYVDLD